MADVLKVAKGLELPLAAATMAGVITGQRGTGKTSTGVVEVEEAHRAGIPSAIVDPTGVWWGLRHGKRPTDHVLFGGFRGADADLPLREQDGREVARLIAEERVPVVLGLRHMRKGAQVRFMAEWAEELYHLNRTPLLVVVDEAHRFAPQQLRDSERGGYGARCLGALVDMVTLGRAGGLGIRLITQRLARLHKDCVESCELIYAHRLMGPNDRKQIAGWLEEVGDDDQQEAAKALLRRIPSFKLPGQCAVYAPSVDVLGEFRIRPKSTFDSSATPDGADAIVEPKGRSQIDLAAVGARLAAAVEEAKANDPAELRKRVRELERELAARPAETVEVEVVREVVPPGVRRALAGLEDELGRVASTLAAAQGTVARTMADVMATPETLADMPAGPPAYRERVLRESSARAATAPAAPAAPPRSNGATTTLEALSKAQRAVLSVLAQFPQGRTKRQVAMLTGYSGKGGGFNNALSSLRTAGFITRGEPMLATAEGLDALGDWEPLPRGDALLEHWCAQVGAAERKVLVHLAQLWPLTTSKDELAEAAGYAATGGGFNNALSRLRTLELITRGTDMTLTTEFAEAIR